MEVVLAKLDGAMNFVQHHVSFNGKIFKSFLNVCACSLQNADKRTRKT